MFSMRRVVALLVVLLLVSLAGCSDDDSKPAAKTGSAETTPVTYELAPLSVDQMDALTQFARSQMDKGRVPEDVAMVASPQPSDLPPGKVLVAVEYANCGTTKLGSANLKGSVLNVQIEEPPGGNTGSPCAGTVDTTALRVSLPENAAVTSVTLQRQR
ncbi:MAG: hypothetical protein QOK43_129 [Acidimicrobiaceae bacterium]|nr:hypothetical protein [Acidimicrobiaceae bacterium]